MTLGVTGAFEAFAEDLLAAVLIRQGHGWAHVAANADLTNPSLVDLREKLQSKAGIAVGGPSDWALALKVQNLRKGASTWNDRAFSWSEVMRLSESWIEVRHCLAHGAVTGLGPERWPGPVSKASKMKYDALPSANDDNVLARVTDPAERGLYLWPSVNCARVFSAGASVIAESVAIAFDEEIVLKGVERFDSI